MPSSEVFHKWAAGKLHSGSKSGPPVKSHAQAIAIYLSEKRKEGQHGGKYPHKATGGGLGGTPPGGSLADNARRWQGFESRFPKDAPPSDWLMGPSVIGNRGQVASGGAVPQYALGGGLGVLPGTNVPPLPGGVGSMMPPQGLGAPMGMRADGGGIDLPNPFLDMDYAPKPPSSAPPPSDALKFWGHPSPKVIPIREHADGGNVVPFPSDLYTQRLKNLDADAYNKMMTQRTLGRALGRDNVVPINPDDKARGGGLGYQFGGSPTSMGLTPGWIERQEARNISHTGPIISAVGGRTDNHAINVPSGSYVLPAAHVSAMGQGNTLNGMQILTRMFGQPMKLPHGAGPPPMRVPRMMGMGRAEGGAADDPDRARKLAILQHLRTSPGLSYDQSQANVLPMMPSPPLAPDKDRGGSRGDSHIGRPVPIMAAGGEFVLSPDQVAKVGVGDVNFGHTILDRWVQNTHKKYAKTIANLPPPAKT